jgi:small GTP-binding protein
MYDYLAKIILLGPSGAGKSCLLHRFVKSEWRVLSSQTIGVEFSSKIVKIGNNTSSARGGGSGRRRIKLQLWDTAGTERFRSVSRSYYRGAAGAILIYDVASLSSFNALPTFLMDARSLASPNLTVVLAGNKADLVEPRPPPSQQSSYKDSYPPEPQTPSSASISSKASVPFALDSSTRSRADSLALPPGTSKLTASTSPYGREVSPDLASRWASKSAIPATIEVSAYSGMNVDELFNRLARMILTKIELGEIDPDDPNSGIQYGDVPSLGWDDGRSVDGSTIGEGGTLRRRKKKKLLLGSGGAASAGEWGDVFRKRGGGGCC